MNTKENRLIKLVEKSAEKLGSNQTLAKYLGANERTVYRWLSGETKPSADYVIAMCELVLNKKLVW